MTKDNGEPPVEPKVINRIILCAPLEHPVEFRVEPDDKENFPDALIMGAYIGGKMIARKATPKPPPIVESQMRLKGKSFIPDIRPLVYTGLEEEVGGDLKAVLAVPANPVKFEDLPDGGMNPSALGSCINLGLTIRLREQRTFPTDLMKECCAHLDDILSGMEPPKESLIITPPKMPPIRSGPLQCIHNIPWRECRVCRS